MHVGVKIGQPNDGRLAEHVMQSALGVGQRRVSGMGSANVVRRPPHILVTTPESLYLLLTSGSGRKVLSSVRTVIIDEIHAVVANRRGSHLALSLERLAALVNGQLQRIGLSATQKPIKEVANFLVGRCSTAEPKCAVVDAGYQRDLDLAIEVPGSPLESARPALMVTWYVAPPAKRASGWKT